MIHITVKAMKVKYIYRTCVNVTWGQTGVM